MPESRVEAGRRRAAAAKRGLAWAAAGGFVVVAGLVRVAHPGTAATPRANGSSSAGLSSGLSKSQATTLGGGAVAPATSQPQVQTQTS